jgi:uncharacterized membrane protein
MKVMKVMRSVAGCAILLCVSFPLAAIRLVVVVAEYYVTSFALWLNPEWLELVKAKMAQRAARRAWENKDDVV